MFYLIMHIRLGLSVDHFKSQDVYGELFLFNSSHARACEGIIGGQKQKNKFPENVCDLRQAINTQS